MRFTPTTGLALAVALSGSSMVLAQTPPAGDQGTNPPQSGVIEQAVEAVKNEPQTAPPQAQSPLPPIPADAIKLQPEPKEQPAPASQESADSNSQVQVSGPRYFYPQQTWYTRVHGPMQRPVDVPNSPEIHELSVNGLHDRYPYYSYRRPWYTPGRAARNVTIVW